MNTHNQPNKKNYSKQNDKMHSTTFYPHINKMSSEVPKPQNNNNRKIKDKYNFEEEFDEQAKNLNINSSLVNSNYYGNILFSNVDVEKEEKYKKEYIIYNLKEFKKNNPSLDLKKYSREKLYLISYEDYLNGLKLKQELDKINIMLKSNKTRGVFNLNPNKKVKLTFYSTYDEFLKLMKSKEEYIFVKEEYFNSTKIKEIYKDKELLLLQIDEKKYLYFKSDDKLLDISEKEKSTPNPTDNTNNVKIRNNENIIVNDEKSDDMEIPEEKEPDNFDINAEKKNIIKNLILIYSFEKEIGNLIESSIKEEYDFNEYYLINNELMELYKKIFNFDEIKKRIERYEEKYSYKGYLIHSANPTSGFSSLERELP